jgi:hypothetical protein
LQKELKDWMRGHPGEPEDLLFPNRNGRPKNRQNELNRMLKPAETIPAQQADSLRLLEEMMFGKPLAAGAVQ